jgi:hypothetical protein
MKGDVTVAVTWMDGQHETYTGYDAQVTDRNNLVISQRMYSDKPKRVIPLDNVRIYTIEEG